METEWLTASEAAKRMGFSEKIFYRKQEKLGFEQRTVYAVPKNHLNPAPVPLAQDLKVLYTLKELVALHAEIKAMQDQLSEVQGIKSLILEVLKNQNTLLELNEGSQGRIEVIARDIENRRGAIIMIDPARNKYSSPGIPYWRFEESFGLWEENERLREKLAELGRAAEEGAKSKELVCAAEGGTKPQKSLLKRLLLGLWK